MFLTHMVVGRTSILMLLMALLLIDSMIMQRYFHEGAVMELVPGNKPVMKLVNVQNPIESIDAGKCAKN